MELELYLSEKFKQFKSFQNEYFEGVEIEIKFLEEGDDGLAVINHTYNNLITKQKYNLLTDFKSIVNINKFRFYGFFEIDGYFSAVETNIEKLTSGFRLLDYDEKLWFDGQSPEEQALWKTFRSFDTRPEIGDGKMAVFSIQEGVSPPNEPAIYYIDRAFCCKTSLNFVQYYEAVLDMMGIADWQLLFTDVSLKDPMLDHYYHGLKESLEALAKAFPDKDYSKYFELLEARWA